MKSLLLAIALVFWAVTSAHADSITDGTLNFTVTAVGPFHGTYTPTGSFVFDNTTDTLTSFAVNWNGVVFDFVPLFTGVDLAVLGEGGHWSASGDEGVDTPHPSGPFFSLNGISSSSHSGSFREGGARASGTYTVNTPDPSSFTLTIVGLGALLMVRKRVSNG
jgi:hypothetical protein